MTFESKSLIQFGPYGASTEDPLFMNKQLRDNMLMIIVSDAPPKTRGHATESNNIANQCATVQIGELPSACRMLAVGQHNKKVALFTKTY